MTTSCEDLVYTTSNSKFRVATKRQIHLKKAGLRPEIKIVSNFLKRAKKKKSSRKNWLNSKNALQILKKVA